MEGIASPTKEEQEKFGFYDIATAIVNTVEATQNAPNQKEKNKNVSHVEIVAMVEKVISKGNEKMKQEIHEEFGAFKEEIVKEARIHAQKLTTLFILFSVAPQIVLLQFCLR